MHQRQCLSVISVVGFNTPDAALLTTMSSRSKCFPSSAKISSTESGMPTLPERVDLLAQRLRLVGAVVVVDRNIAAALRELERDGAADATGGAGDESDVSGQSTGHVVFLASRADEAPGCGGSGQNRYFNPGCRLRYNRAFAAAGLAASLL
jgi:hypothetical protein